MLYCVCLCALFGCHESRPPTSSFRQSSEPISFPLDDFSLTERNGARVGKTDLLGKVWIGSFVFTRCTGPCPQVTATMARLQAELAGKPEVKLVTFTVDPERDDPKELIKYADLFRADKDRWWFLTGDEKEIHRLLQESFKIGVQRNQKAKPGDEIDHSTRLAVVDRQGNVRGYFNGMGEPAELEVELGKLLKLVNELLAEKP